MKNPKEIIMWGRSPDRRALVRKQIDAAHGHPGHAHFWERALSRRQFIKATGAVTGALILASGH